MPFAMNGTQESKNEKELEMGKLTRDQVWEIYFLIDDRRTLRDIAEMYGVEHQTISHIKNGESWRELYLEWIAENGDVSHWVGVRGYSREKTNGVLTEQQVRELHSKLTDTNDWDLIADEYNVSLNAVQRIAGGKSWRHLGLPIVRRSRISLRGENNRNSVLTESKVRNILRLYNGGRGMSQTDLAKRYKVKQPTIHNIVHRKTWKWLVV